MPYILAMQPSGLSYTVEVWVDGEAGNMRVDYQGGVDQLIINGDAEYNLSPRIDTMVCGVYSSGGGPTRKLLNNLLGGDGLPKLKDWEFGGVATINGLQTYLWVYEEKQHQKTGVYKFYVTPDGVPIKLHMFGINYMTGSHFDEYVYDFEFLKAGPVDPSLFIPPAICKDALKLTGPSYLGVQLRSLLPSATVAKDHGAFKVWSSMKRDPAIPRELDSSSLSQFAATKKYVEEFNSQQAPYKLGLNRFAHMSEDEFVRIMLPNRLKNKALQKTGPAFQASGTFVKKLGKSKLPKQLDWRATLADPGVKDQASCGSCWAFATTGALEGSWYVSTGQVPNFSEQHLIDCSWDYGHNYGCDGGDQLPALNYVLDYGGIASELQYPYEGLNDFCRAANYSVAGTFKNVLHVPSRDEEALMEALYTHGPLSVGVNAEYDFVFYAEGVYREVRCGVKVRDLDHAVVLVGYGTSGEGEDFWIVKNSWSKFWGQDGYIKISREYDCGISTDAVVALVAPEVHNEHVAAQLRAKAVVEW